MDMRTKRFGRRLILALALHLASPSEPRSQTAGDAVFDRLETCGLNLVACAQGAMRAGTPLKVGGCRTAYRACRKDAAQQDTAAVVECRQECGKAWNRCRKTATPAFIETEKACLKRLKTCKKGVQECRNDLLNCREARRGLDACIDGRQVCEATCKTPALVALAERDAVGLQ